MNTARQAELRSYAGSITESIAKSIGNGDTFSDSKMPARASRLQLVRKDFAEALTQAAPQDIVSISCIDFREEKRAGYLLTSAGNIPHSQLLEDLHLILEGKKFLVLRAHSDCKKSKLELRRERKEGIEDYLERLEKHTLKRLLRDSKVLLSDPQVQAALKNGLRFCAAYLDSETKEIIYFEKDSMKLVDDALRTAEQEKAA